MRIEVSIIGTTAALLVFACSQTTAPKSEPPGGPPAALVDPGSFTEAGRFTVEIEEALWIDVARGRSLPVRIHAPAPGEVPALFPGVALSHGFGESRFSHDFLASHWAAHGYIVVAVQHPGTDAAALAGPLSLADVDQRFPDLQFVVDQMCAAVEASPLLAGRVDCERIAAVGHSLGSSTALSLVGLSVNLSDGTSWQRYDPRVRAAIALSPQLPTGADPTAAPPFGDDGQVGLHDLSWSGIAVPILLSWGSRDRGTDVPLSVEPDARRIVYERAGSANKHLVVIDEAEHDAFTETEPWYTEGPRDPRHHEWIQRYTTAFLHAYVFDDAEALAWLLGQEIVEETGGACTMNLPALPSGDAVWGAAAPYTAVLSGGRAIDDAARGVIQEFALAYPAEGAGPFPLVVFSHYAGGQVISDELYVPLVSYWAAHGYVVLVPQHREVRGQDARDNWAERVADVRFLLDNLAAVEALEPTLTGRIDGSRIGVGGHYLGAHTAGVLSGMRLFGPTGVELSLGLADARIDAALMLSPTGTGGQLTTESWPIATPLLVMTGSEDYSTRESKPPAWRTEPFWYATRQDKYLVFVDGLNSSYGGLVEVGASLTPIAPWILAASLAFWDATLGENADAGAWLALENMEAASQRTILESVR